MFFNNKRLKKVRSEFEDTTSNYNDQIITLSIFYNMDSFFELLDSE